MPRKLVVPLFVSFLLLAFASCRTDIDHVERLKPFQGSWSFVELNEKGVKPSDAERKKYSAIVVKDKFHVGKDDDVVANYYLRVDPTKTPAEVDWVITEGEHQGEILRAIFEFDGDKLKMCTAEVGKARPTEFAVKPGSTWSYYVMQKK